MSPGLFVILALLGVEVGSLVTIPAGTLELPAMSPALGILVGALLAADARRWRGLIGMAFGVLLVSAVAIHGRPLGLSTGLTLVSCLEAYVAAMAIQRTLGKAFSLDRIKHIWTFIVVSTLVPVAGGFLAAAILRTAGPISLADWRSWSLSEALGILLVAPIVIGAISGRASMLKAVRSGKGIEIAVVFAGAVLVTEAVFGELLNPLFRVPAYVLPLLLWPAFRFGPAGSAAMVFTIVFFAFMHTAHGMGPFALASAPPPEWILRSQVVSCVIAASFLLLAAEVAERKRIARENAALILELQQALAEIKTLRGFIPICAWCHKIRNDAGYWQQIESYLHAHTEATFSHGICPVCEAEAHKEIEGRRASARR